MTNDKFDLLKRNYPEGVNDLPHERVRELRALARSYRDANNELVKKIWDAEQKLVLPNSETDKASLMKIIEKSSKQLEEKGYIEKIHHLLEEIRALEIELYGHSDIGGNSPYKL